MVIEQAIDLRASQIVKTPIPKLIAMFIPRAPFIPAIISIYDTIMFFVEKLPKIGRGGRRPSSTRIAAIAAGAIAAAANRVESDLAGLLSLAISFLAGFVGLGNVAEKVMGVIKKVRAPVDKALDRSVEWIVAQARRLGRLVAGPAQSTAGPGSGAARSGETRDLRARAAAAVQQRLTGEHARAEVPSSLRGVLVELAPQGLRALELGPREPDGST